MKTIKHVHENSFMYNDKEINALSYYDFITCKNIQHNKTIVFMVNLN
jgi:hypothetical protein